MAFLGEFGMNHVESRKEKEDASPAFVKSLTCLGDRRNGALVIAEVVIFRAAEL